MLFAQIETVPSDTFKNVVLIVAGLLAMGYYVKEIFFRKEPVTPPAPTVNPQPLAMEKEFATKLELKDHVDFNNVTHRELFAKIGGVERGARDHVERKLDAMAKSAEDGREKLHSRINEILTSVSELRGEVSASRGHKL